MKKIIIIALSILGLTVCGNSQTTPDYKSVVKDPLLSYRKGHYRNVVEYFEKNPRKLKNIENQYALASSYIELRDYQKAFDIFYQIDVNQFLESNYKELFPFFVRKYLNVLIELNDTNALSADENKKFLEWISLVPEDSPIRPYMDNELFEVLWNSRDFTTILLLNQNLSPQGKGWRELAKFEMGQAYNVRDIILVQRSFSKNLAYSNILPTLSPMNFRNPLEISNIVEMSLRVPSYRDLSLEFAERFTTITRDREYYPQILSSKYRLDGNGTASLKVLTDYIDQNPNASLSFYVMTYETLVRYKQYDSADDIATRAFNKYQKEFYRTADGGLEFHKDPNYVLRWYQANYKDISKAQHLQAIRALIRTDLSIAEKAVDLGVSENIENTSYLLMYGLIKEHQGKLEEAYKMYLQLIFQDAFGYAGIVSKQKEKAMREQFRSIFDDKVKVVLSQLEKYELKDRLMLAKSFLVDEELSQYVDKKALKRDQEAFNKIVYKDINNIKPIASLENYPKSLTQFAPETQDYVENSVLLAMKGDKDWHNTARYYYKYKDIFLNSDIEGYLTFRLYFYIRDQFGSTYLPNYPKDIVELAFPKPEFALIKEWADGDGDLAYWMLASFMAESHFRKRVYSQVGAVGFAQVMPYTAKDIKRWLKMPYLSNNDFYDNMRMGVYYHKRMYDLMDQNMLLSLAAYNAGPGSVTRWKAKYDFIKDDYLFIEAIDYRETRNYVKIINYNYGMYRLLNDYKLYN